jgi:feruloyl esterase
MAARRADAKGLMSAQKYPEDFDAILAGAPANYQTHLHAWDLSVAIPVLKDPGAAIPASKLAVINRAALNACDARDGVTDGLINDPRTARSTSRSCSARPATVKNVSPPHRWPRRSARIRPRRREW